MEVASERAGQTLQVDDVTILDGFECDGVGGGTAEEVRGTVILGDVSERVGRTLVGTGEDGRLGGGFADYFYWVAGTPVTCVS